MQRKNRNLTLTIIPYFNKDSPVYKYKIYLPKEYNLDLLSYNQKVSKSRPYKLFAHRQR